MIRSDRLEDFLSGIDGLPTLPIVLQQIQKVMNNPRSSMGQIATIVAKDQALASKAIRLVNSAYYARATPVASIQQAIIALGLKTLNNLMIGLSVIKIFSGTNTAGYDPGAFWEHSFGTALLAKKIAELTKFPGEKEECFVAGLLHDMGRLVMEQYMHVEFTKALTKSREEDKALFISELEVLGVSHAEVGACLGRRWNIPVQFINAMEYHHKPEHVSDIHAENDRTLVRIVAMANELCTEGAIGASGERLLLTNISSGSRVVCEAKNKMIEETRKEVVSTIREWGQA